MISMDPIFKEFQWLNKMSGYPSSILSNVRTTNVDYLIRPDQLTSPLFLSLAFKLHPHREQTPAGFRD